MSLVFSCILGLWLQIISHLLDLCLSPAASTFQQQEDLVHAVMPTLLTSTFGDSPPETPKGLAWPMVDCWKHSSSAAAIETVAARNSVTVPHEKKACACSTSPCWVPFTSSFKGIYGLISPITRRDILGHIGSCLPAHHAKLPGHGWMAFGFRPSAVCILLVYTVCCRVQYIQETYAYIHI